MVHGNSMDKVVVVETTDPWSFATEINGVLNQEPLFYVDSTHVDAHTYKAILITREIEQASN